MNEAVFISDLHLSPQHPDITARFIQFCQWCKEHTRSLYILGDFFHLWIGDDEQASWTHPVIEALLQLHQCGIVVYFMGGNRDFLLGRRFCQQTKMHYLTDATYFPLSQQSIALTHGDRLCTKDTWHQWFYFLTRNRLFRWGFMCIPLLWRRKLAQTVRQKSQDNKLQQKVIGQVTLKGLFRFQKKMPCQILIHGHTHQPALHHHVLGNQVMKRYVLSDWDDKTSVLCYHSSKGFYFYHI